MDTFINEFGDYIKSIVTLIVGGFLGWIFKFYTFNRTQKKDDFETLINNTKQHFEMLYKEHKELTNDKINYSI